MLFSRVSQYYHFPINTSHFIEALSDRDRRIIAIVLTIFTSLTVIGFLAYNGFSFGPKKQFSANATTHVKVPNLVLIEEQTQSEPTPPVLFNEGTKHEQAISTLKPLHTHDSHSTNQTLNNPNNASNLVEEVNNQEPKVDPEKYLETDISQTTISTSKHPSHVSNLVEEVNKQENVIHAQKPLETDTSQATNQKLSVQNNTVTAKDEVDIAIQEAIDDLAQLDADNLLSTALISNTPDNTSPPFVEDKKEDKELKPLKPMLTDSNQIEKKQNHPTPQVDEDNLKNKQLDQLDGEFTRLLEAIQLNPHSADLYYKLGIHLDKKVTVLIRKEPMTKIDLLLKAIDLDPNLAAMSYCALGDTYESVPIYGVPYSQKELYAIAIEKDPAYVDAYFKLGKLLREDEEFCYNKKMMTKKGICLEIIHRHKNSHDIKILDWAKSILADQKVTIPPLENDEMIENDIIENEEEENKKSKKGGWFSWMWS